MPEGTAGVAGVAGIGRGHARVAPAWRGVAGIGGRRPGARVALAPCRIRRSGVVGARRRGACRGCGGTVAPGGVRAVGSCRVPAARIHPRPRAARGPRVPARSAGSARRPASPPSSGCRSTRRHRRTGRDPLPRPAATRYACHCDCGPCNAPLVLRRGFRAEGPPPAGSAGNMGWDGAGGRCGFVRRRPAMGVVAAAYVRARAAASRRGDSARLVAGGAVEERADDLGLAVELAAVVAGRRGHVLRPSRASCRCRAACRGTRGSCSRPS